MHILLVDDTPDTLKLFCMVLELHGFHVQVASDGEEGVQGVAQASNSFDAIILDVEMPRLNGWDALRAIRQLPHGRHSYIVMFTAYGDTSENRARACDLGADSILQKPVLPQVLIDHICHGVAEKQAVAPANS